MSGSAGPGAGPRRLQVARIGGIAAVLALVAAGVVGASSLLTAQNVQPREPGAALPIPPTSAPVLPGMDPLRVSDNKRFLQYTDGRPFFWLGDTGWEMFHRAGREDARRYLDTRAEQGFTVIQAVALAEKDGLETPTPAGHVPLEDEDPSRPAVEDGPDNDYWDDVDFMVDYANAKGMYVGFWVAWGSMVADGPEVLNEDNAKDYGRFLGERYQDKGIIWVLGGDRDAHEDGNKPEVWEELAEGIREFDEEHLMSYHPYGEQSSIEMWPNDDSILDFNMIQGGHQDHPIDQATALLTASYAQQPTMPVLDSEINYEEHPIAWDSEVGWHVAWHSRASAYYQVFAGGFGHTYGNGAVHQFWEPGMDAPYEVRDPWYEALHHEGAGQMRHLAQLMLSRSFFDRVPDQSLVMAGDARATRSESGTWAMVYLPHGGDVSVDTAKLAGTTLAVTWFNPRTGESRPGQGAGTAFTAPDDNDWVLILDAG